MAIMRGNLSSEEEVTTCVSSGALPQQATTFLPHSSRTDWLRSLEEKAVRHDLKTIALPNELEHDLAGRLCDSELVPWCFSPGDW